MLGITLNELVLELEKKVCGGGGWLNANMVCCLGPTIFLKTSCLDLDQAEQEKK
jgi:hypothetical protein